jgi:serine/threonine protein phosphatase PrpC
MVEDREIQALLQQNEKSTDACRALVGRALEHGGRDNVTTVVARYSFP